MGEPEAGSSQRVYSWCLDLGCAIATQVTVAKVICIDDDNVGFFLCNTKLAEQKEYAEE